MKYNKSLFKTLAISSAIFAQFSASHSFAADEVNVYSYRQDFLVEPLFKAFTDESGIKVNHIYAKDGLIERVKLEGEQTPMDIILTVDIGRAIDAVTAEIVQPLENEVINTNIPQNMRDPNNEWFALTSRARLILTSKERVEEGAISTYQDLADPQWQGKVCTRSGKHPYMVALTASIIANEGEEEAKNWLQGVKDNLARKPQGNDREQAKAIAEGICDVAVMNSYYIGAMLSEEEQKPWVDAINVVFPNQDGVGTHLNISAMSLGKYAPNKESAVKLMEFLSDSTAQEIYAEANYEYPVKEGVSPSELLQSWGDFKADDIDVAEVAKYREQASKLADEVGYDL